MTTIHATIGTDTVKIDNVKHADLLENCMTPHMDEQLKGLLEDFVAKAACNHGSLAIGDKVITTGMLPAIGKINHDEIRTSFASAVSAKVEELMSDYLKDGAGIDYTTLAQGEASPAPAAPVVRPAAGAPNFDPLTAF